MAVEKLILRSILYGADKIPDSWFEKLPGGYYRDSHGRKRKIADKDPKDNDPKTTSKGRKAEIADFYPEREDAERGRDRRRDRYRGRSTSSYDGGADYDDDYDRYGEDGRPHRSKSHRKRRSPGDDRHRHADRHGRSRYDDRSSARERYHDDRHRGAPSPSSRDPDYDRRRSDRHPGGPRNYVEPPPLGAGPFARAAMTQTGTAAKVPQYFGRNYAAFMTDEPPPPSTNRNGNISNGYVPYAHIYGTARQSAPQQPFSPDSFFDPSAMRTRGSPIAPHSQRYSQATVYQGPSAPQQRNVPDFDQYASRPGSTHSNGYESRDHARHNREDRRKDGSYSKSMRYADQRSQPEPREQKPNRPGHDRYRSDFDGSYGEAARRSRRVDGYNSE